MDVHPYEEAQGFQRLLDVPGYDVAALAEKSGKSTSHIYARLSLLQLIPTVAEAFVQERITASHANLIARLPQEHQAVAFENCWRKDWQDNEAHLLPAKHLSAWIQADLYLNLAEAPFDREDIALKPEAGACVTCPRRSGYNTSLFADVQGDQCLDGACFQSKITAHIDREIAARPELVQIETAWRSPKEERPGALNRNQYRELAEPDNPDAEQPCPSAKAAIIVFGKNVGRTVTVCLDEDRPAHTNHVHTQAAEPVDPPPVIAAASDTETEEEAAQRKAEHEQRMADYQAEQKRREEERKAEFDRQQREYEAEQSGREKQRKARVATFDRIIAEAPASFNPDQLRFFLRLLINVNPYDFLEEAAAHFSIDENEQRSEDEVVLAALSSTADEKLIGFALRIVLADHIGIPRENTPDLLIEAEQVFAPKKPKVVKPRSTPAKSLNPLSSNRQRRKTPPSGRLPSFNLRPRFTGAAFRLAKKRQGEPAWVSPCTLIPLFIRPPLSGCAAGVKFRVCYKTRQLQRPSICSSRRLERRELSSDQSFWSACVSLAFPRTFAIRLRL